MNRRRNADGNLVNVGNFDADGANLNNNRPDNPNDNLGVCSSRSASQKEDNRPLWPVCRNGGFYVGSLIHPPSIFPISTSREESSIYVFSGIAPQSLVSRTSTLRRSSSILHSCSTTRRLYPRRLFARSSVMNSCTASRSSVAPRAWRSYLANLPTALCSAIRNR